MDKIEYRTLSEENKRKICQKLNPYDENDWAIFKETENLFIEKYGEHEAIDKVFCGLAPMLGPYCCITVYIGKDRKRIQLPEYFNGFPIFKIYESKSHNYKLLIK